MITFNWQAEEKLQRFTPADTSIVTDFDQTVITANSGNSWGVFVDVLWAKYATKAQRLYWIFRPHEANDKLDPEKKRAIMARWWRNHLSLFRKTPLMRTHLTQRLTETLMVRTGISDMLEWCRESSIPIMVFSAGVAQVIEMVLERDFGTDHGIHVLANRLLFWPEGKSNGVENDPIHVVNKNDLDLWHLFPEEIRKRTNAIVLWDSPLDAQMVSARDQQNVLTVGFLNQARKKQEDHFRQQFDIVVESDQCDSWVGKYLLERLRSN